MDPLEEPRPSIQYHRHHHGHPMPVLLNFSSITIAKGTKWQTLAILRLARTKKKSSESLFWLNLIQVLLLFCHAGLNPEQALSLHLSDTRSKQREQMKCCMEHLYGETERQSRKTWVFIYNMHPIILCHSSMFVFFRNHRETLAGDSIFGLFTTQTHNMVPSYQILLTITDSLRVKAVV